MLPEGMYCSFIIPQLVLKSLEIYIAGVPTPCPTLSPRPWLVFCLYRATEELYCSQHTGEHFLTIKATKRYTI